MNSIKEQGRKLCLATEGTESTEKKWKIIYLHVLRYIFVVLLVMGIIPT